MCADYASYYEVDGAKREFELMATSSSEGGLYELPGCNCSNCNKARREKSKVLHTAWSSYDNLSIKKIGDLVDDALNRPVGYLLCARNLRGFVFSTRTWGKFPAPCYDST